MRPNYELPLLEQETSTPTSPHPNPLRVYLFAVYGKWDQADLTPSEEKYYREVLSALKAYHRQLARESERP